MVLSDEYSNIFQYLVKLHKTALCIVQIIQFVYKFTKTYMDAYKNIYLPFVNIKVKLRMIYKMYVQTILQVYTEVIII